MCDTMSEIINKIAKSGLVTLNPAEYYQQAASLDFKNQLFTGLVFDLKDQLFKELILREKEFRDFIKQHDWSRYVGQDVAITCSADAIVPIWPYMLIALHLRAVAKRIFFDSKEAFKAVPVGDTLIDFDVTSYQDKKVLIKGCANKNIPIATYIALAAKLQPVVQSLAYGEACSNMPLYKRKNNLV